MSISYSIVNMSQGNREIAVTKITLDLIENNAMQN
jgi:hypothetical protein